ncbi:hypothetical protein CDV55_106036 [Aspergillus turcosus]|uniref:Uncharacterized protein n=1 Tax=Aspergillus turcosus TaxID=1245748 RepID=A0A229YL19_9EURO|nr:hypothetical protein CDV55_106036 [Aspergillus turcosus]RLL99110.1 hypothetical protein CFD26_104054 [Aspergillus turcosus]
MLSTKGPRVQWKSSLFLRLLAIISLILSFATFATGANVLTFDEAVQKGNALYCLMRNTQEGAAAYMQTYKPGVSVASPWTDYNSLATWGWVQTLPSRYAEGTYEPVLDNYITTVLQMPTTGGVPVQHVQDEEVVVNGIVYPESGGNYANVYYPSSGLLVADENYGPESTAPQFKTQGVPYVLLKQWSDIAFLNWQQQCTAAGASVSNLKAVIRFSIVNTDAGSVIPQVTGGQTIGGYKNPMVFQPGDPNFNALLGTPNASGVAWLLINHKAQMGIKTIASISLFRSKDPLGGGSVTNMAFEIVDYSPS